MSHVSDGLYKTRHIACSMADLGNEHWNAIKWVFRYLAGTHDMGIVFDQKGASKTWWAMWIQIMQGIATLVGQ